MSCCNGNCGCSGSCGCGSGCKGCAMYPDISERTTSESIIDGIAPVKAYYEGSEMSYGAEHDGCNCGADCKCGSSCKCGK
ncbi:Metallothionein [Parasponia andersonii]|uniref:Metallothionein-like protein n=1 Tax=Parasponia andersonii TaxID=3476 RepID=A0A2P5AJI2_PARAD|nr:Metallothionein [Parasponia andersonii]